MLLTICSSTFEIIPVQSNQNKSPVIHAENHLGLESWCIPHVYDHAHKLVLQFKQSTHQYTRGLPWNSGEIVKYLNVALLINPDVSLFWNIRRYLFEHNKLNLTREFQYSGLVLSRKAKSNESFAYRRWLFMFLSKCGLTTSCQSPPKTSILSFQVASQLTTTLKSPYASDVRTRMLATTTPGRIVCGPWKRIPLYCALSSSPQKSLFENTSVTTRRFTIASWC